MGRGLGGIVGSVAGGILGGRRRRGEGGGPQQVGNTVQSSAPWTEQIPFLTHGFAEARKVYDQPLKYFPSRTTAPFDPLELEAMRLGEARARAGSPELARVRAINMGILNNDPATLQSILGPRIEELLPQLSHSVRQGRGYGSLAPLAQQKLIQTELSRLRGEAMDRAIGLSGADYEDIGRLAGIGEARRDQAQEELDAARERYAFQQMEPAERLARYMDMVRGGYGSNQSSSNFAYPARGDRLSGILGGAMGGAQLGRRIFGGGSGGILGPVLGGLL